MIDITDHLRDVAPELDATFRAGVAAARAGIKPRADYDVMAGVRERHGFMRLPAPLLTADNHKLLGATVKSYGLTLHHFRTVLPAVVHEGRTTHRKLSVNLCPNAGHCTRVCVLNNGHGRWDSTQRAWKWRTDLLVRHPDSFARILAWELVRAVRKHGRILYRPDVNSDAAWWRVLPSLTDGSVLPEVFCYGYSKRPEVLAGDGWMGTHYRVAYSWNETSRADDVRAFYNRGGAVAVVTGRKKGSPVLSVLPFGDDLNVTDADVSDEWMLTRTAVVGDLSAKGKARQLIGRSRFVVLAAA
jgi:hypothetical protein